MQKNIEQCCRMFITVDGFDKKDDRKLETNAKFIRLGQRLAQNWKKRTAEYGEDGIQRKKYLSVEWQNIRQENRKKMDTEF
jgi:hypothetical protein